MECPKCNQSAISFVKWASGMSAFKTECANCGTDLKANAMSIVGFIVTLIIVAALVVFSKYYLSPELSKNYIRYIAALPVAIVLGPSVLTP